MRWRLSSAVKPMRTSFGGGDAAEGEGADAGEGGSAVGGGAAASKQAGSAAATAV
jgi:hypothetical protein